MSQGELAKSLGISRQAVSKWENSSSVPDMENMLALAEVFGTELEYIASGTVAQVEAPPPPAPVIVNLVETKEKIVERVVEKPVLRRVIRYKYLRNPVEYILVAIAGCILGFLLGKLF